MDPRGGTRFFAPAGTPTTTRLPGPGRAAPRLELGSGHQPSRRQMVQALPTRSCAPPRRSRPARGLWTASPQPSSNARQVPSGCARPSTRPVGSSTGRRCSLRSRNIGQGSEALSEIDFLSDCAGISPARARDGRRSGWIGPAAPLPDAMWRRSDGRHVVVESRRCAAPRASRWWSDQLRQNELTLSDAIVLRFRASWCRTEPALVAAQLARALGL